MNLKKTIILSSMVLTLILSGCAVNFAGKTPVSSSDSFRFITGNEVISKDNYTVKGIVVVQRMKLFFDLFGLIKSPNKALSEVFTEDIANELTEKVQSLGGNAVMDIDIVNFSALPGGLMYLIPIGIADVTIQATAIDIK
jgi:hypothetical protein|tara:strand:- start:69 stop:488 length:420 start_codon:yes stop_codon:yes gene_type:complete